MVEIENNCRANFSVHLTEIMCFICVLINVIVEVNLLENVCWCQNLCHMDCLHFCWFWYQWNPLPFSWFLTGALLECLRCIFWHFDKQFLTRPSLSHGNRNLTTRPTTLNAGRRHLLMSNRWRMRIKERGRPCFCNDPVCENNGTSSRPHSGFVVPTRRVCAAAGFLGCVRQRRARGILARGTCNLCAWRCWTDGDGGESCAPLLPGGPRPSERGSRRWRAPQGSRMLGCG